MNETDLEKLLHMNHRLSLVLGVAMSLIFEWSEKFPEYKKAQYYWLIEAVGDLIYFDKPLPRMPK